MHFEEGRGHYACVRGSLRNHEWHPQPHRADRGACGAARPAVPDRRDERLRRTPTRCCETLFDAVAASSNKCIEGVPGLGFVIARRDVVSSAKGNATTLVLDLHDQWQNFEKTGQFRFTPPIHVIVAFHQALKEFWAEGGVEGRGGRYAENGKILIDGMRELGFRTLLPADLQAPIIVTFHMPQDPAFVFQKFYDGLSERGFLIYPGKLTVANFFRIGCIGRLYPKDMRMALGAVRDVLTTLGVATPLRKAA